MVEYHRKFIELLAPLEGVHEEIAKGQFINGLKGKIKAQVRVLGPTNLDQAIENRTQVAAKMGPKLGECIWSTTTNPT